MLKIKRGDDMKGGFQTEDKQRQLEKAENYYKECEQLYSDSEFSKDELKFLRSLVNKYFLGFLEDENFGQAQALVNRLTILENKNKRLMEDFHEQMKTLKDMAELEGMNESKVAEKQASLKEDQKNQVEEIKMIKKELFYITENIMKSDKVEKLTE